MYDVSVYRGAINVLRMTIYGVSKSYILSDSFWQFEDYGIEGRHQILIYCAVVISYVIIVNNDKI